MNKFHPDISFVAAWQNGLTVMQLCTLHVIADDLLRSFWITHYKHTTSPHSASAPGFPNTRNRSALPHGPENRPKRFPNNYHQPLAEY